MQLHPVQLCAPGKRWAILTAHNPGGRQQSATLNDAAHRRLGQRLEPRPMLAGVNGEGDWAEASFIVPGLPLAEALRLGREFSQVAVLYGTGQRVALVWCGEGQDAAGTVERFWMARI